MGKICRRALYPSWARVCPESPSFYLKNTIGANDCVTFLRNNSQIKKLSYLTKESRGVKIVNRIGCTDIKTKHLLQLRNKIQCHIFVLAKLLALLTDIVCDI